MRVQLRGAGVKGTDTGPASAEVESCSVKLLTEKAFPSIVFKEGSPVQGL